NIRTHASWSRYGVRTGPADTASSQPASDLGFLTAMFIAVAVSAGIGGVFAFLFRRRRTTGMHMTGTTGPAPSQPPGPVTGPPGPLEWSNYNPFSFPTFR